MVTPSEMKLLHFPPAPPKASPKCLPQELCSFGIGMPLPVFLWLNRSLAPQMTGWPIPTLERIKDTSLGSLAKIKAQSSLQDDLIGSSKAFSVEILPEM